MEHKHTVRRIDVRISQATWQAGAVADEMIALKQVGIVGGRKETGDRRPRRGKEKSIGAYSLEGNRESREREGMDDDDDGDDDSDKENDNREDGDEWENDDGEEDSDDSDLITAHVEEPRRFEGKTAFLSTESGKRCVVAEWRVSGQVEMG